MSNSIKTRCGKLLLTNVTSETSRSIERERERERERELSISSFMPWICSLALMQTVSKCFAVGLFSLNSLTAVSEKESQNVGLTLHPYFGFMALCIREFRDCNEHFIITCKFLS